MPKVLGQGFLSYDTKSLLFLLLKINITPYYKLSIGYLANIFKMLFTDYALKNKQAQFVPR